jgi:hypothetical protein
VQETRPPGTEAYNRIMLKCISAGEVNGVEGGQGWTVNTDQLWNFLNSKGIDYLSDY